MTHRIVSGALYTVLTLLALAITVAYCQPVPAQMHDHHPDWLQRTGCCGPRDCFELRVRYTPLGWEIVAMRLKPSDPWMPPPGTIIVPPEAVSPSKDGRFWGCFMLDHRGRPTTTFYRHGYPRRICFFQPGSGQ